MEGEEKGGCLKTSPEQKTKYEDMKYKMCDMKTYNLVKYSIR